MPLPPKHRVPARGTQTGTMRPNDTLTIAGTERMRQGIYMYRKKKKRGVGVCERKLHGREKTHQKQTVCRTHPQATPPGEARSHWLEHEVFTASSRPQQKAASHGRRRHPHLRVPRVVVVGHHRVGGGHPAHVALNHGHRHPLGE